MVPAILRRRNPPQSDQVICTFVSLIGLMFVSLMLFNIVCIFNVHLLARHAFPHARMCAQTRNTGTRKRGPPGLRGHNHMRMPGGPGGCWGMWRSADPRTPKKKVLARRARERDTSFVNGCRTRRLPPQCGFGWVING